MHDFEKNVALSASAGSGKTRALTDRLITMFLSGIKPSEVLVVTFTNMAASDIKEKLLSRLDALAGGDFGEIKSFEKIMGISEKALLTRAQNAKKTVLLEFSALQVSTIHSFLLSLLQAFPERMKFPLSVNVIDNLGKDMMLLDVIEDYYRTLEKNERELKKLRDFSLEYSPRPINIRKLLFDIYEKVKVKNPSAEEIDYYPIDELEKKYFRRIGFIESDKFETLIVGLRDFIKARNLKKQVKNLNGFADKLFNLTITRRLTSKVYNFFSDKLSNPMDENGNLVNYLRRFYDQLDENEKKIFSRKLIRLRNLFTSILEIEMLYFTSMWIHVFLKIDEIYRKKKNEIRGIDFNDIENYALNLLNSITDYKSILFRLDKNIKYIMIDEFQDTSVLQWESLKRIASECLHKRGSIFIVADVKQSIYRWRGGDPGLFERVKNEYRMEKDTLRYNYRQSENLLKFVNLLFQKIVENVNPDYPYEIQDFPGEKKNRMSGGYVRIEPLQAEEDIYRKILEWIKRLHGMGIGYSEIAILCRRNNEIENLEHVFISNHIPFISQGKSSILTDYCIRDILNIFKMLSFPENNNYVVSFMRSRIMRMDFPLIYECIHEHEDTGIDVLKNVSEEVYKKIKHLEMMSFYCSLSELLMEIYSILDPFSLYPKKREVLVDFLEIIDDFEKSNPGATIEDFILFMEEFGDRVNFRNYDMDGVILQTIHSAKGLEYHTVILPFLNKKLEYEIKKEIVRIGQEGESTPPFLMPGKKYFDYLSDKSYIRYTLERMKKEYQLDELNNLYVALTRAKENLIILPLIKSKNERSIGWMVLDLMGGGEDMVYELGDIQGGEEKYEIKKKKNINLGTPIFISTETKKEFRQAKYLVEKTAELIPEEMSHEQKRLARLTGIIFHKAISIIGSGSPTKREYLFKLIRSSLDIDSMKYTIDERERAIEKACFLIERCLKDKRIARFFSRNALSEVDVFSRREEINSSGVRFDRVLFDEQVEFLDFKTTPIEKKEDLEKYTGRYRDQMRTYHSVLSALYPDKVVLGYIYFPDAPYELRIVKIF